MPYADLDDARLHFQTAGESGTPVLLIMGFGVPGRVWEPQVEALSRHHRVAFFDNRGSGGSRARAGLWSMRTLARDAVRLLDHLGWADAHVAGVSMGGMVAQELALRWRPRARSLTLIATHAGGVLDTLPTPRGLRLFARGNLGPPAQRVDALQQLLYPAEWLATADREDVAAKLRAHFVPRAPGVYRASQLAAVLRHRAARRLPALEGLPTLVVRPGRDVLVRPSQSDRLHRLIPGSRLLHFEHAGHGVTGQCADELNAALLAHFAAADQPGGDGRRH